jgi:hypothetical protein
MHFNHLMNVIHDPNQKLGVDDGRKIPEFRHTPLSAAMSLDVSGILLRFRL